MDRQLVATVAVIALGLGLVGLHGGLGLPAPWLVLTIPFSGLLGLTWLILGWITGLTVRRQGAWWPRRAPCLGGSGRLPDVGWHARDMLDFLDSHWILAALVLGGCLLALPMAPFCFLAWWLGVCRGGG